MSSMSKKEEIRFVRNVFHSNGDRETIRLRIFVDLLFFFTFILNESNNFFIMIHFIFLRPIFGAEKVLRTLLAYPKLKW